MRTRTPLSHALPLPLLLSAVLGCGPTATVQPDHSATNTPLATAAPSVSSSAEASSAPLGDAPAPKGVASEAEMAAAAAGDTEFALALFGKLKGDDNTLVSPASARIALAMAYAGARGNTATQMAKVLAIPNDPKVHDAFGAITRQWLSWAAEPVVPNPENPTQPFTLRVANRLFGQQGRPFAPAYLTLLQDKYGAPLEQIDFKTAAEPGRLHINQWVEDHTEKRIKDLLPPNSVDAATRMVLVNALYFKADWLTKFEKARTTPGEFESGGKAKVKASMMSNVGGYRYAEAADAQIVELPYRGAPVAMTIVLPRASDGLAKLEASLTPAVLNGWIDKLAQARVHLQLPRFKVESSFQLGHALGELGMGDAFDATKADFSGIDGTRELSIGEVVQKTFCAVDEAGTEAAAATAVIMRVGSAATEPPKTFNANHPFLFLIRDTKTGSLLFLGRVTKPA